MDNMDIYDLYDDSPRPLTLLLDPEALRLYWTTKGGAKIFIEDMETSHIENIIKAGINGKLHCTEATEARFLLELSLRRRRTQTITNLGF